jgi:ABC-type dipeptide/oligopeptide/nickel transport system permease component
MSPYLIRRLFSSAVVIVGVPTLVFCVIRMVPGDPADSIMGDQALVVDKERFREAHHLDKPLHVQYGLFLRSIFDGSLGRDFENPDVTVASILARALPATVELALASMAFALLLAIPLGVISAVRQYSWVDNGAMLLALVGVSMPNFWLGPMLLILFSLTLRWLPNPGEEVVGLTDLVLPTITLGTALLGKLTRMTRAAVLEVLGEDYVRTARAKGLSERVVLYKHVMRNALVPVMTIAGLQFGAVLTGAIITEKVFARPGLGTLLLSAIEKRNFEVVQGTVILVAFVYVAVNLATDLAYALADPRIRYR